MIERPKYLEYRHQRDRINSYVVRRQVEVKVERPAAALMRLVGKKTKAKKEGFQEEWSLELRTTDVMPDRSALVKTQVTQASRIVKGESVPFPDRESPTTEFLNEVVDLGGQLSSHQGSLPTPHLILFPEEPVKKGHEWQRTRHEMLPVYGADGQLKTHAPHAVTYSGRVDEIGEQDDGVEFVELSISGQGEFSDSGGPRQVYSVSGTVRFALRDGHILNADVTRAMMVAVGEVVVTRTAREQFAFTSRGTEQSVGGMRM